MCQVNLRKMQPEITKGTRATSANAKLPRLAKRVFIERTHRIFLVRDALRAGSRIWGNPLNKADNRQLSPNGSIRAPTRIFLDILPNYNVHTRLLDNNCNPTSRCYRNRPDDQDLAHCPMLAAIPTTCPMQDGLDLEGAVSGSAEPRLALTGSFRLDQMRKRAMPASN
jgi:hypothetical protein